MMTCAVKGDGVFDFDEPQVTLCWKQFYSYILWRECGNIRFLVIPSNLRDNQLTEIQNRCSLNRLAGNAE